MSVRLGVIEAMALDLCSSAAGTTPGRAQQALLHLQLRRVLAFNPYVRPRAAQA